jgi:RND family efflux transporter MFP subunit
VPVSDAITDYEVFTGRTQALQYVDIRARVTGYLEKALFQEGDDVKEGAVLFEIDPRPYKAALDLAKANLVSQKANAVKMEAVYKRTVALAPTAAVAKESLDTDQGNWEFAKASVEQAEAALDTARLNLDFAKVHAPFSGRIGRRQVDPGNLIQADNTIMVSLVQLDPLYAYFDVDERTLLRIRELLPEGKIPHDAAEKLPVTLGFANENPESYTHKGSIRFTDNKVDPSTGTLRMWGTFENPKHDLYPNLFIRVRLGTGHPRTLLFVAEAALGSDQGRKFLYVVGPEDKIVYTPVEVGQRHNGLIAVEEGLSGGEKIVVNGLQRVKPGMEVDPKVVPMPRPKTPATKIGLAVAKK